MLLLLRRRQISLILIAVSCVFLTGAASVAQTKLDGAWQGALVREGSEATVSVIFKPTANGFNGTMTMLSVGMFRQPLSNIILNSPQIHFEQENLTAVFDGEVRGHQITGSLKIIGLNATFHLRRSKDEPLPYTQEEVQFRNGNIALAGTLTLPLTRRANPAIVFTHGGGPDTRDLSRFYADHFARVGIASLIYDKRGVGGSSPDLVDWGRSSFADLSGDALAGIHFLQSRKEIDPTRIGLYGPSNGGWVVEYAAARSRDVAFIIVVSGGAIPSWESEVYRVEAEMRAETFPEDAIDNAVAFMRQKFEVARTGQGWEQFQTLINRSRREKWFRLVNAPSSLDRLREAWSGQFAYDPGPDLGKAQVPVLALFGERDTETPAKRIAARTEQALREARNKNYLVKVFTGASHGLLMFPEEGKPWFFFKFADDYVNVMTEWVLKQTRK